MRQKPKRAYKGETAKSNSFDRCQTPGYALDPLLPYLNSDWLIWEPAMGEGNIVAKLGQAGFGVTGSDILTGQNFFTYEPPLWDCQVTNPAYSIKYQWLERSYQLGKPFALLMPVETQAAAAAIRLFERYGVEIIQPDKRINFKMPFKGWNCTAQFPVAWFTWGLGIGSPLTFVRLTRYADEQRPIEWPAVNGNEAGQMSIFDLVEAA